MCPLCRQEKTELFLRERERDFHLCQNCELIFVPPVFFNSREDEKKRYDCHQNSPDDAGYRDFLNRLVEPLCRRIKSASSGLDFGSGPGPTLSVMLQEAGHTMEIYDLYYAPREESLRQQYDFITATEVIEHLREPRETLDCLWSCLRPGGIFGAMTQRVPEDRSRFSDWYYKNDPTHIVFYSSASLQWLARHWQSECEELSSGVFFIRKPD